MAAAATSVLSLYGSSAFADSSANGTSNGSPGVLSGNTVQAPVDVPVNVCGNTVDAIALLNPAFGGTCGNSSGAAGQSSPGATSQGVSNGSPGVLSGNTVQAPVDVPVNVCGNTADAIALLNPASGNSCGRAPGSHAQSSTTTPSRSSSDASSVATPPRQTRTPLPQRGGHTPSVAHLPAPRLPATPAEQQRSDSPADHVWGRQADTATVGGPTRATLAATGSGAMLAASGVSSVLLAAGVLLYRRGRAAQHR